ncbi:MAG: hypothetical protein ACFB2Z_08295 [Maricaulaceae bacterium]
MAINAPIKVIALGFEDGDLSVATLTSPESVSASGVGDVVSRLDASLAAGLPLNDLGQALSGFQVVQPAPLDLVCNGPCNIVYWLHFKNWRFCAVGYRVKYGDPRVLVNIRTQGATSNALACDNLFYRTKVDDVAVDTGVELDLMTELVGLPSPIGSPQRAVPITIDPGTKNEGHEEPPATPPDFTPG